jgi:hypothetical protein
MKQPSVDTKNASPFGQIIYFRAERRGDILVSDPGAPQPTHLAFAADSLDDTLAIRGELQRAYAKASAAGGKETPSGTAVLKKLLKSKPKLAEKFLEIYKGNLDVCF